MAVFNRRVLRVFYLIGIAFKGLDGVMEVIGGSYLFFVSRAAVHHVLLFLARAGLAEDPDNFIAHHVLRIGKHLTLNTKTFISIYLFGHGLVKLALVVNLLRNKGWAYPAAIAVLLSFIGYQIFRLIEQFSVFLAVFTILDIAIVILIGLECRYRVRELDITDSG